MKKNTPYNTAFVAKLSDEELARLEAQRQEAKRKEEEQKKIARKKEEELEKQAQDQTGGGGK